MKKKAQEAAFSAWLGAVLKSALRALLWAVIFISQSTRPPVTDCLLSGGWANKRKEEMPFVANREVLKDLGSQSEMAATPPAADCTMVLKPSRWAGASSFESVVVLLSIHHLAQVCHFTIQLSFNQQIISPGEKVDSPSFYSFHFSANLNQSSWPCFCGFPFLILL